MIIKIIVFIIILGSLIVVGCSASERNSTTYRSFVTDGLGFYKIRNIEAPPVPFTYEDCNSQYKSRRYYYMDK